MACVMDMRSHLRQHAFPDAVGNFDTRLDGFAGPDRQHERGECMGQSVDAAGFKTAEIDAIDLAGHRTNDSDEHPETEPTTV